ncbi:MAG: hypothetical protein N2712_04130 [Brevinematales bacterium]|nr:hypothetical protein [Brevinematales bacterium]
MKIVGLFDKYTSEIFKFLGVDVIQVNPNDQNLSTTVIEYLSNIKNDKKIFSVLISKNISSRIRKDLEDFVLSNTRPSIVEVDPIYNIEKYEDYETMIKRVIRETIGIRL